MNGNKVYILWTNDNPETAHTMVFMYAINSLKNNWFEEVEVIIWGPTAKLVSTDEGVREKVQMAMHAGVKVVACIACANMYGVKENLEELGIEVFSMGGPLTELLKNKEHLLTI